MPVYLHICLYFLHVYMYLNVCLYLPQLFLTERFGAKGLDHIDTSAFLVTSI